MKTSLQHVFRFKANNYNAHLLDEMKKHCVEIAKLLHYSWNNGTTQIVTKFIQHLIEIVNEVHMNDLPAVDPQAIPDEMKKHCVEIAKLLHYSWNNGTHKLLQSYTAFNRNC